MAENKWPWEVERTTGVLPWQTPTGEGFRAPWSKRYSSPWGVLPQELKGGEGLTPETYLQSLYFKLQQGDYGKKQAEEIGSHAVMMISQGTWDTSLPFFGEIQKGYYAWQGNIPEQKPSWLTPKLEEKLTRLDLEKFKFQQQQFQWQQQQDLRQQAGQAGDPSVAYMANIMASKAPSMPDTDREKIFEEARQSILGSLTGPGDWIKRWQAQAAPNPYKVEEEPDTPEDIVNRSTREARDWSSKAAALRQQLSQAKSEGARKTIQIALQGAEAGEKGALKEVDLWQGKVGQEQYYYGAPQTESGMAPLPGAPGWLPQFAPGQRAGRQITKEQIPTPSGQQLTRTPWSVMEGLRGYTEFTGGRPYQDILEHAQLMQPRTPYGAGGMRWSPAGQR